MIINLRKSSLFTSDPANRFARQYGVQPEIWRQLWKRRKLLEYTDAELCEILQIKSGIKVSRKVINRWMFRGEIYELARPVLDRGASSVNSAFFGTLEQRVISEILKHLKAGETRDVRILA